MGIVYAEDMTIEPTFSKLGSTISNKMSVKQMQKAAGANFVVEKFPEYIKIEGEEVVNGKYSLVRRDNNAILSSVSEEWQPCQNDVAFGFFQDFVEAGDMQLSTAGVLDEGRIIWCMAELNNEAFSLFRGKDEVKSYFMFSNPHQYGKAIILKSTSIRAVCQNTYVAALRQKSDMQFTIHHRNEFDPAKVKEALAANKKIFAEYKEKAEFLATKKVTDEQTEEYFQKIFPKTSNKNNKGEEEDNVSRNAKMLMEVRETQPGAEFGRGTWWQNFNAVTFAVDHLIGHNDNSRMMAAFWGKGADNKVKALDLAMKMAA